MIRINQERLLEKLDLSIVIFTCLLVFSLPISIALVESFSGFVILFFVIKKYFQASHSLDNSNLHDAPAIVRREYFWRVFRKNLIFPKHPLRIPLLILMVVFFLTVIVSHDRVSSLIAYFGKFLQGVALMLAIHEGFKKQQHLLWVAIVFILSVILVSLSGISQLYFGHEFLRGNPIDIDNRISSSLRHANDLGLFLIIGIGVIAAVFYTPLKRSNQVFKLLLICILGVVIFVLMKTFSRSAWVGLIMMVILASFLDKRFLKLLLGLGIILVLFFMPSLKQSRHVSLFYDNLSNRTAQEKTESSYSGAYTERVGALSGDTLVDRALIKLSLLGGSGRAEYWEKAIRVIQTAPVLGTGLNTYSKQVDKIPGFWGGGYAHNCYLQMTAETGLMGITAFLYFIISLFCFAIKSWSLTKDIYIKPALVLMICSLFAYLTQSFFDTTFYSVQLGVLLWIISGFILAIARMEPKLTNPKP